MLTVDKKMAQSDVKPSGVGMSTMQSTIRRKFNESALSPAVNKTRGSYVFKTIAESDKHLFKSAHLTSTRKMNPNNILSDSKLNTSCLRNFSAARKTNPVGERPPVIFEEIYSQNNRQSMFSDDG